jgi:hypothetical protein
LGSVRYVLLLFFSPFILAGCADDVPRLHKMGALPADASCSVAILPFVDRGHFPNGANLLYKVMTSELVSSDKIKLVNEGDILKVYQQLNIFPTRMPDQEQMKIISNRLGVKLFIAGDILRMAERPSGRQVNTELTVIVRMYEGPTGNLVWGTYHKRRGLDYRKILHFGRINTITGLTRQVVDEILELWFEEGMTACSE